LKKKQKKILLLIPNVGFGGAQKVFFDLSKGLSMDFDITECVFNYDEEPVYKSGNKLISLNVNGGGNLFNKVWNFFLRIYKLRKIKKENSYDFCISYLEGADYVNILSKVNEKAICFIHGSKLYDQNIEGGIGRLRKKILIPLIYRHSDLIITVSDDIKREMILNFGQNEKKVISIPNFFDVDEILDRSREPIDNIYEELFLENRIVIAASRLARQKNLYGLLDVWKDVTITAGYSDLKTKLVILGDGELRDDLLLYAKSLNLRVYNIWDQRPISNQYDVYFMGYTDNPFKFISRSHLFVLSSSWEGFPMALCESMISGACAISTDCPTGPRQILNGISTSNYNLEEAEFAKYGILMPLLEGVNKKKRVKEWSTTINYLLTNKNIIHDYKEKGKERIDFFTQSKVMIRWIELLNS
jgi:glycosyltransferase involved in cell wall biosynthesis